MYAVHDFDELFVHGIFSILESLGLGVNLVSDGGSRIEAVCGEYLVYEFERFFCGNGEMLIIEGSESLDCEGGRNNDSRDKSENTGIHGWYDLQH